MGTMWHSWRAAILEDLGELPPQFEETLVATLRAELEAHRAKLEDALTCCVSTLATLRPDEADVRLSLDRGLRPVTRDEPDSSSAVTA